jgi:hypothetical protein
MLIVIATAAAILFAAYYYLVTRKSLGLFAWLDSRPIAKRGRVAWFLAYVFAFAGMVVGIRMMTDHWG